MSTKLILENVNICNPDRITKGSDLVIEKGKFTNKATGRGYKVLDLKGCTVYPGLINSHDHLLGTYLPRVGNGPYLNWKPWDEDLKASDLYKERGKIPADDIYLLGYYRQILSGVTTVSDHIPHQVNRNFIKRSLVRVVKDYALAHEASSYDLKWGGSIASEVARARKRNIPFITHLEEGYDQEAKDGVPNLIKAKALFRNTVLIHCISCSAKDIKAIGSKRASMVWCPTSNVYMFGETADIRKFIGSGANITLGTDSPMSGGLNLLEELKFAARTYHKMYGRKIAAKKLFQMVTINGARAFKLDKETGSIEKGKSADLIVIKDHAKVNAYDRLIKTQMKDLELVILGGKALMFKEKYAENLAVDLKAYQKVNIGARERVYLIGKPLDLKKRIDKKVGFKKQLEFFPVS